MPGIDIAAVTLMRCAALGSKAVSGSCNAGHICISILRVSLFQLHLHTLDFLLSPT